MKTLKYILFSRESNDFSDILNDTALKKKIYDKTLWHQHLLMGIVNDSKVISYVTLKYGESIRTDAVKDFSPIPNIDYTPIRN